MLGQLDLWGKNKVEVAIERIRMFEPKEGYYLAFSGGKDSQCIYHLAEAAGVKFSAHYRVTSVDPPELVRFIKTQYPDVKLDVPKREDGTPATMWNLIPTRQMPPTRIVRYCCQILKETGGQGLVTMTGVRWAESANRQANQGLVTMTGVRWAESANRQANQGLVTMPKKSKKLKQTLTENGVNFQKTMRGGGWF